MSSAPPAPLRRLQAHGLLYIGTNCVISPHALFEPADLQGVERPINIGDRCRIMAGAIIYGGVTIGDTGVVEEHAVIGKPEFGYAVRNWYSGSSEASQVGDGAILRAGCIVHSGVRIGINTTIGHGTLLRSFVCIGDNTQLGHGLTVERATSIGNDVRCSPLSHITSSVVLEDRVFLGAGVITINDKGMIWRDSQSQPELAPPYFEHGARIGSGSTIAAGVRLGRECLVGSGSVVTRDVPPYAIAYGVPARVHTDICSRKTEQ